VAAGAVDNAGKREGDREGIVGKIGREKGGREDGGGWGRGSFARNIPGALAFAIFPLSLSLSLSLSFPLINRGREGGRDSHTNTNTSLHP
jgi:hypothetical protein